MKPLVTLFVILFLNISSKGSSLADTINTDFEIHLKQVTLNMKLHYEKKSVKNSISKLGFQPYTFNKYIQGTGEKFAMLGLYVNLFDDKLKLNLNNTSDYLLTTTPWALLSLNFKF
jgi:hypothetical protein